MRPLLGLIIMMSLASGAAGAAETSEWPRVRIGDDADGHLEVVLENGIFLARYGIGEGGKKGREWAIRDLVIKAADGEDQAGSYIDACASRGFLDSAEVIREAPGSKTVRLTFDDGNCHDVTIRAGKPYLRMDYWRYGVNVVDIGSPGGGTGEYVFRGGEKWRREYVGYPKSYYNRYAKDVGQENVTAVDPTDGGPLAYREHYIMAVVNPANGRGFGRVAPVRHVKIIKLLFDKGFELFAHLGDRHEPYTSYVFLVTERKDQAMALGKQIVDTEIVPSEGVGGPRPGDVYREWTWTHRFHECDPNATNEGALEWAKEAHRPRPIEIGSLDGAVRAEVSVQIWGGHIGTTDQKFRVNGGPWIQIPQPRGTPTEPQAYYRTLIGDNAVEVPLEQLREGRNVLAFGAGSQLKRFNFGWGFFWVYSFTVRVYYGDGAPHAAGRIVSPETAAALGEKVRIRAEIEPGAAKVKQVDFIGLYEDFDWEGNGLWRQWHYHYHNGEMTRHLGTATKAPYEVAWDTTWLPDQQRPVRIMARIVSADGTMSITPAVNNLRLSREGRSVRMVKSADVPENFGSRVGKRKKCTLEIPSDPAGAASAKMVLSTWSAKHADELTLNGKLLVERIGPEHNYSFDVLDVPLEMLKQGANEFTIFSETEHHAAEVNWPGPVLLLEYHADTASSE